MPQTLLSLLALALSSTLVFNQQRLTTAAQTRMVTDEIELAASALSADVLEFAEARSFDEATTPSAIQASGAVPGSAASFSDKALFGSPDRGSAGCDLITPGVTAECDDVDDLDGLADVPVQILLANGRSLPFQVSLAVDYVTGPESTTPSATPTLHKRIRIRVRSPFVRGGRSDVLEAPRVISYDPIKAAKDHEDVYGPIGA